MEKISTQLSELAISMIVIPPLMDWFNCVMSEMAKSAMQFSQFTGIMILIISFIVNIAAQR